MEDESKNLEHLRWVFDKQIGWNSSAETKATAFVAFIFAIFAALGSLFELKNINSQDVRLDNYGLIFAILAVFLGLLALFFLLNVFCPKIKGLTNATHSVIFFNLICARSEDYFKKETHKMGHKDLLEDISVQIYANAHIAKIKHKLILRGVFCTYIMIILAIASIILKCCIS